MGFLRSATGLSGGVHLDGDGVYLRHPRDSDWSAWAEVRAESRDFLQPWEPTWPRDALTRSAYRLRLRQFEAERREGTGHAFFIFRRDDEALVGGITLSNIRRGVAQAGTIGYWISRRHARRGYMTAALHCLAKYAFGQLNLHRIEAACQPDNGASRELLRKFDFDEEGRARLYLLINGSWSDHLLFGLVREDYLARRR
ncbi:MAG: GNAT family N-acetyltransferase [Alphaproteobacteria bacterium]|nr:GNAT family N-acetyltransferase [Alphaproteobacteria bacterium]